MTEKTTLYVFSISHYCEKAKWALDYFAIPYQLHTLIPGPHIKKGKQLGLKRGSVPILQSGNTILQGSAKIVDWSETNKNNKRRLYSEVTDVENIEKRLDEKLGIHLRRYYYSEAVIEQPHTVKPIFADGANLINRTKLHFMWPAIVPVMIKAMDLGPEQGMESLAIVEQELDWLDELLSADKKYLYGDEFSAADLAAASLLAPLVLPKEHPKLSRMQLPPKISAHVVDWQSRPFWGWVHRIYQQHRTP